MSDYLNDIISNRLNQLHLVEKDLRLKNTDSNLFRAFWKGLVRDHDGRWNHVSATGIKYFQYGTQPIPNLADTTIVEFLHHALQHERQFLLGLRNGSYNTLKNWLISLHKEQSYKGMGGRLLNERLISSHEHTNIVNLVIVPLADKYNDTYTNTGKHIVNLPYIDHQGLPMDEWIHSEQVRHYYPDPKHLEQYLAIMQVKLGEFVAKVGKIP